MSEKFFALTLGFLPGFYTWSRSSDLANSLSIGQCRPKQFARKRRRKSHLCWQSWTCFRSRWSSRHFCQSSHCNLSSVWFRKSSVVICIDNVVHRSYTSCCSLLGAKLFLAESKILWQTIGSHSFKIVSMQFACVSICIAFFVCSYPSKNLCSKKVDSSYKHYF